MDKKDTLILLGDSPFLGDVQDKLPFLLSMYPSMGINVVILKYHTMYHVFQDSRIAEVADQFPNIKTVTTRAGGNLIKKDNKELVDSFSFSLTFHTSDDIIKDGKLGWCGFTHDYAVSWAIWKGFRRVVLVGASDFVKGPHYTLGGDFKVSSRSQRDSTTFISEFCSKRIEVLTCNPKSSLSVPRIKIDELLH